jgi:acetyl-CoA acetyltransferase
VIKAPLRDVVIVSAANTPQAKVLEGHDSFSITLLAARLALAEAGTDASQVDAVFSRHAGDLIYTLGVGPAWDSRNLGVIASILEAAALIQLGFVHVALVAEGGAGFYTDRSSTAPWTRPANEFVLPFGLYTAVEFALVARHHMDVFGTRPEHLAEVSATIRNNGSVNPDAVYFGRGPYTAEDVLASRMVADPFHLLDCAMTAEGGTALVMTSRRRAGDLDVAARPVYILGGGLDHLGPAYRHPPTWDLTGRGDPDVPNGYVGRRAARHAFAMAGLRPTDVDCCEFYDPFSFEIIRQLEAHEFCGPGEGPDMVMDGTISPSGRLPVTTDGGTMSFSHGGGAVQMLQRVVRGVHQIQGTCQSNQVRDAQVVLCSNGGSGALFNDVILLGADRP